MQIVISNNLRVSNYPLPVKLKITDDLTIENPAFRKAKYQRRPTWGIPQKLQLFTYDNDGSLILPRGYLERLKEIVDPGSVSYVAELVEGKAVDF